MNTKKRKQLLRTIITCLATLFLSASMLVGMPHHVSAASNKANNTTSSAVSKNNKNNSSKNNSKSSNKNSSSKQNNNDCNKNNNKGNSNKNNSNNSSNSGNKDKETEETPSVEEETDTDTETDTSEDTAEENTETDTEEEETTADVGSYGVFIGAEPEDIAEMITYDTVVVDAAYFTKAQINELKKHGCTVYSYLNIGSIEDFRNVGINVDDMILGDYDDWPGEQWIDVSYTEWQDYIVNTAAKSLVDKGVDGFFLDNVDVYYNYKYKRIFTGLIDIIDGLNQYEKDLIINGGDVFVSEAILNADTPLCSITGVNQETVFTAIDFDNDKLLAQTASEKKYFLNYLAKVEKADLAIFLLEYADTSNESLRNDIITHCTDAGWHYYIASSIDLDSSSN